ncbi:hypothetical protein ACFOQM_23845 [Paenibacillus sp. GCM10012307]|uniref:Uncharacterized protein n=1 Tax=Paenibacillus roseus TaxID=2798579 RepID=A0A934MXJ8_9BACL|nr:hypothetical protein [Paenibacillus roseus]MBJ6364257.1 hypothetical protein [Paenibacillus roseus]
MRRKMSPALIVIIALAVIGIAANVQNYLIPVLVLGLIFLLYYVGVYRKNPSRYNTKKTAVKSRTSQHSAKSKSKSSRKTIPFRVIEGGKDDQDQDDMPKYH